MRDAQGGGTVFWFKIPRHQLAVVDFNQTAALLSVHHHAVEQVHDNREALERVRAYKYDLIILDWHLPTMPV